MVWDVEFTDEFGARWESLTADEQVSVRAVVGVLEEKGPALGYPYSSDVKGSRHRQMRELCIQHAGDPYRVLYAFDPRRAAVLLLGGSKAGDARWYDVNVPKADQMYDAHLEELRKEGLI